MKVKMEKKNDAYIYWLDEIPEDPRFTEDDEQLYLCQYLAGCVYRTLLCSYQYAEMENTFGDYVIALSDLVEKRPGTAMNLICSILADNAETNLLSAIKLFIPNTELAVGSFLKFFMLAAFMHSFEIEIMKAETEIECSRCPVSVFRVCDCCPKYRECDEHE